MIGRISLTVASRLALTVLSLVSSIITARVLGQSGRGDYFFIITLSGTLVQLTNLGLPVSATYDVARDPETAPRVIANALWVSVVAAGGTGTVVAIVAHAAGALQDTPVSYLLLAAALAPASLFFTITANVLTGQERFAQFNLLEAGSRALAVAAIVVAGVVGAGAGGFVWAAIAAWVASAILTGWAGLRGHRLQLRFDAALFRAGFRFATKAYIVTLLAFLVLRANVFLLRHNYDPGELGLYSIAAQFSDVLAILPQAVSLVLFPRLVKERDSRWQATQRATVGAAILMAVTCGLTAIAAGPLIRILYGPEFEPAADVLRIMLPGVACLGIVNVLSQYLAAEGIPRLLVAVWGAAAALVSILSLALVPGHAGAGAAAALSITYAAVLVAVFLLTRKRRPSAPDTAVHLDLEGVPAGAE